MTLTLRQHDRGRAVITLQRLLNQHGHGLDTDGVFGAATAEAVRAVQRAAGIVVDGIVGAQTYDALHRVIDSQGLTQAHLQAAADDLGVDLAAVMAVNEVESRGRGFIPGSRHLPVILFERHVMLRQLKKHDVDPAPHLQAHPEIVNAKPGGYVGGVGEHIRLQRARAIHDAAGIESASWGRFQIMGFHWKGLGYNSAQHFADAMAQSEHDQLMAFVRFIDLDGALRDALANHDWVAFARGYNGPDFARNDYDSRLAAAWARHHEIHGLTQVARSEHSAKPKRSRKNVDQAAPETAEEHAHG